MLLYYIILIGKYKSNKHLLFSLFKRYAKNVNKSLKTFLALNRSKIKLLRIGNKTELTLLEQKCFIENRIRHNNVINLSTKFLYFWRMSEGCATCIYRNFGKTTFEVNKRDYESNSIFFPNRILNRKTAL